LHVPTDEEAEALVWRAGEAAASGAEPIIGPEGQFRSEHGFLLDRLAVAAGEECDRPPLAERDVLFVHQGSVELRWPAGVLTLGEGDTITVPAGLGHRIVSAQGCILYRVTR
jgi:mannose-6-phosphate isomerase-like protein (cupin superfamily)